MCDPFVSAEAMRAHVGLSQLSMTFRTASSPSLPRYLVLSRVLTKSMEQRSGGTTIIQGAPFWYLSRSSCFQARQTDSPLRSYRLVDGDDGAGRHI